jgi:hypothetical protein
MRLSTGQVRCPAKNMYKNIQHFLAHTDLTSISHFFIRTLLRKIPNNRVAKAIRMPNYLTLLIFLDLQ